jgi:HlyD family type I secretion membrane fusion protein
MDLQEVPSWKRPAALGYAIIILTFGVGGGWSVAAKIDAAVVAQGVVMVESNRKTVQHLEGGIVSQILVREGQYVREGQVLFRLDTTQSRANFETQQNQLDANLVLEARLIAERDGLDDVAIPDELRDRANSPFQAKIVADQQKQFAERRASLIGQIGILEKKVLEYKTEIDGVSRERASAQSQVGFIERELEGVKSLLERNLVPLTRYLSLEREKARLEGTIGRATADLGKAENGIAEANLQIGQLRQKFLEEVSASITDARQKVSDLREKLAIASDVFRRSEIPAPRSGVIQNLHVFTIGGVIRAGEPLAEIAPDLEELIVRAHVSPLDIDRVAPGMAAEVRFSGFHTTVLPLILGRVDSISRDRLVDDQNKQPYFLAQIVVDESTFPAEIKNHLIAGMSAEVLLPTGERTVLSYLTRPLYERVLKSMRER